MSKTSEALALVDSKQMTPHAAAIAMGITPTAVYRAIKMRDEKAMKAGQLQPCPCCHSLVKPEQIDLSKIKE